MQFPGGERPADAKGRKAHDEAFARWVAEERARVEVQRRAFARAQPNAEVIKLMLDRAWALLDAGECEAADALLEFVPEWQATKLLDEFFPDSV